jgi:Eukaryotic aspartyl protease
MYDPSKSHTAKDVGQPFSILYGDNSTVSGEQYTDTVTLAGFKVSLLGSGALTGN